MIETKRIYLRLEGEVNFIYRAQNYILGQISTLCIKALLGQKHMTVLTSFHTILT